MSNKFFCMDGYVCQGYELRSTASGKQVTSFTLNCPTRRKVDGEWKSEPQFFECQYWHKDSRDWRPDYIREKSHIWVSGEMRYDTWESQNGKRHKVVFVGDGCRTL